MSPSVDVPALNEAGEREPDASAERLGVRKTNLTLVVDLGLGSGGEGKEGV